MPQANVQLTPELPLPEQSPTTTPSLPTSEGLFVHGLSEHVPVSAANVPRVHRTAIAPLGV